MAIRARGETPFDEAGDGVVLCFTNTDLKNIQAKLGEVGWMNKFVQGVLSGTVDHVVYDVVIRHGVKKDRKPAYDAHETAIDYLVIMEVAQRLVDALFIAMFGKDFDTHFKDSVAEMERVRAAGGDLPSPESPDGTISTNSAETPSGPASE